METIEELKSTIKPKVEDLTKYVKELTTLSKGEFESYVNNLSNLSKQELIDDFKNLKFTPGTITISIIGVTTVLLVSGLLLSSKTGNDVKDGKKKKKKVSKAHKTNKQIQEVLDNFETKWVPEINDYLLNYKDLSADQIDFKYTYFQEMLLKELFKLDGIDTLGNPIIKENRKKVIQFIQDHQKRLDAFKKELDL